MITLQQFIELQLISNIEGLDATDREIMSVSIITGKTISELEKLKPSEFSQLYKETANLEPVDFAPLQAAGGYRIPSDAGQYPLRQWITIENQILKNKELLENVNAQDFSGVPDVLAYACLPADVSINEFAANDSGEWDTYNEPEAIQHRANQFLISPANEALGLFAFFLNVLRPRKSILSRCLAAVGLSQKPANAIIRGTAGTRS